MAPWKGSIIGGTRRTRTATCTLMKWLVIAQLLWLIALRHCFQTVTHCLASLFPNCDSLPCVIVSKLWLIALRHCFQTVTRVRVTVSKLWLIALRHCFQTVTRVCVTVSRLWLMSCVTVSKLWLIALRHCFQTVTRVCVTVSSRVVESESVESHVFSWSRSRESESVFKTAGVGVGSRSRFFKTAGVGVGSRSRFFKTAGVGVGTFVAITDSNVY